MIYFLGGAPRTGKSKFAEDILRDKHILWIPLDIIRNAIIKLLPPHDLRGGNDEWITLPKRIYPVLEKIAEGINNERRDCIIEGDCFFPEQIQALIQKSLPIKVCFIGSSSIDAEYLKAKEGWHNNQGVDLNTVVEKIKNCSEIFKQKCIENSFKYIDIGKHDSVKFEEVKTVLFEN